MIKIYLKIIFIIKFNNDVESQFSRNLNLLIKVIFYKYNKDFIIHHIYKKHHIYYLFYRFKYIITIIK